MAATVIVRHRVSDYAAWREMYDDFANLEQAGVGKSRGVYRAIAEDGRPPIPYSEILRTSWIMEEIFSQLNAAQRAGEPRLAAQTSREPHRGNE